MVLPRQIALKSKYNSKYLRYINEDVQIHGFLQYSGDEVVSPYAKFEVETAKSGKGLVHIRCSYNNKYWARWSSSSNYIVAGADEADEDLSKWSCTLFEPVYDSSYDAYRFRHVQLDYNACLWRTSAPYTNCVFAKYSTPDKDLCDLSTVIDWESLFALPKHVAFKGDNGSYLRAYWFKSREYLQFSSNDIGDPYVGQEIFTTSDGSIRIKNDHWGKFWIRDPNWIHAKSTDNTTNDRNTLFWPVRVENNVVALRNLGNDNFCKRLTQDGKTDCLNAGVKTISKEARMTIEELVLSRNIYNVEYRLMDARIYGETILTMATGDATNNTTETSTVELRLKYEDAKSNTWTNTLGIKLAVGTKIQTGIPIIAEGQIEISTELSEEYSWGETRTTTTAIETVYTVAVPPMSRVKVRLLATQGHCDVPFSYAQRDTLTNGEQETNYYDDGVYTGVNCYNFKYETKQEAL